MKTKFPFDPFRRKSEGLFALLNRFTDAAYEAGWEPADVSEVRQEALAWPKGAAANKGVLHAQEVIAKFVTAPAKEGGS